MRQHTIKRIQPGARVIHCVNSIQQTFLEFIRASLGNELYQMWFEGQFQLFCGEAADALCVSAENPFVLEWYRRNFQSLFQQAAQAAIPGFAGTVRIGEAKSAKRSGTVKTPAAREEAAPQKLASSAGKRVSESALSVTSSVSSGKPRSRSSQIAQRRQKESQVLSDARRTNIPEMMRFLAGGSSCADSRNPELPSAVLSSDVRPPKAAKKRSAAKQTAQTARAGSTVKAGKAKAKKSAETRAEDPVQASACCVLEDPMAGFIRQMDQLLAEGKIRKSLWCETAGNSLAAVPSAAPSESEVKRELVSEKKKRKTEKVIAAKEPEKTAKIKTEKTAKNVTEKAPQPSGKKGVSVRAPRGSQKLQDLMANVLKLSSEEEAQSASVPAEGSMESGVLPLSSSRVLPQGFRTNASRSGHVYGTFESFVAGYSNRVAFTTARSIHRNLGLVSPILFTGGTGVGKTHLLDAIYRNAITCGFHSVCKTCEEFMNDFVASIRDPRKKNEFYSTYQSCDVLILDNLQFLLTRQGTVSELKSIFSSRIRNGKQIVLAADRPLAELEALGPEFCSQLRGGCECHLSEPSFDVRLGILARESQVRNLPLTDAQQKQLATQYEGDARALLGALNTLEMMARAQFSFSSASSSVSPQERTSVIEQLVEGMMSKPGRTVSLDEIKRFVAAQFALDVRLLSSGKRTRKVSQPRMLAMWLARKFTRKPLSEIGQSFGCASHSTVISAQKKVEEWRTHDFCLQTEGSLQSVNDLLGRLESQLQRSL